MPLDPHHLSDAALGFLTERHLATLTTQRDDGSAHVVPVGFTWDDGIVRVITSGDSRKAVHARRPQARAAVCQVDGRRWLSLEGPVRVLTEPEAVRDAEARYTHRYRPPRENPRRVVLLIEVERVLGHVPGEPLK